MNSLPRRANQGVNGLIGSQGVVALEFILIFPLIISILYAASAYGVLFFQKYQLQNIVDRASVSVFALDRNQWSGSVSDRALEISSETLEALLGEFDGSLGKSINSKGCIVENASGVSLLRCQITAKGDSSPMLPQITLPFVGSFPPFPKVVQVEAAVAF
ncbi:TadE-like protein [Marinobacter pelagius]|uniref:TadE-like protein n=1 Tax=Marinobacter pelagius TaxID=379482 RepID=A0A366GGP9_9GAMM|nr:TadE/TadG family type IV pilus assembly protein [Marinobacter pelagius]RBP25059.1 TadE-like protein [Marinobacter pelagius]